MSNNNGDRQLNGSFGNGQPYIINFEHDAATGLDYTVYSDGSRVQNSAAFTGADAPQNAPSSRQALPSFNRGFAETLPLYSHDRTRDLSPPERGSQFSGRLPPIQGFRNDFEDLPPPPGLEHRRFTRFEAGERHPPHSSHAGTSADSQPLLAAHGAGSSSVRRMQPAYPSAMSGQDDLPPLPPSDDEDFPPPQDLAKGAKARSKAAGSRGASPPPSKGKGKAKAEPGNTKAAPPSKSSRKRAASTVSGPPAKRASRGGRARGAGNYTAVDKVEVSKAALAILPTGGNGWLDVAEYFNERARRDGRPERDAVSLKKKYDAFLRVSKPTGDGECPEEIELAHQAEHEICCKAGSRELGDSDEDEDEAISISSSDETQECAQSSAQARGKENNKAKGSEPKPTAFGMVRRVPNARTPRANNQALLSNLANHLDPATQAAREEARSSTTMQMTQIFSMSAQIRDLQAQVASLHEQLRDSERRSNDALRRADIAELKLHASSDEVYRQDVFFPGGGRYVGWFNASDSEELRMSGCPDEPGSRRYITSRADIMNAAFRPPHRDSLSPVPPPLSLRPASPAFRSAASNLNHMVQIPADSDSGPSGGDPGTADRAEAGPSRTSTALIISPRRRRQDQEDGET
ncbi:hypothetical protein EV714DRAFT_238548 [Schizophyllum commune]